MATDAIIGAFAAPSMPGTAYVLFHHVMGETNGKRGVWAYVRGGMGGLTQALAQSAKSLGVEIRTDAEVARIISQERQKLAADRAQIDEERRKLAAAAPIEQPQAAPPAEADVQPRAVAVEPADTALTPYLTPLRDKDKGRILRLAASRTEAIAKSVQNAAGDTKSRTAVAAAQGLLATPATPASASQIAGRWRCRTLSIGGSLGENSPEFAAAIGNFYDCQIENSRNGLTFKKLTGSMKKLATLSPLPDGRMLYYGTSVAQDERLPVYPAGDDYGHEVGVLEQLGDGRLRLELPDCNTSGSASHEVIELVRARK